MIEKAAIEALVERAWTCGTCNDSDVPEKFRVFGSCYKCAAQKSIDRAREGLRWYEQQVAGCRKLGSIGDPFRQALDHDGGDRARAILAEQGDKT